MPDVRLNPAERLLIVVDIPSIGNDTTLVEFIEDCLAGGARRFWIRDHVHDDRFVESELRRLLDAGIIDAESISLGGRVDLAARLGTGVHLGSDADPAELRRVNSRRQGVRNGQSCHNLAEVVRATVSGLDYATLSPIFATVSAKVHGRAPLGLAALRQAVSATRLPIYALGGVTPKSTPALLRTAVHGVASLGAVSRATPGDARRIVVAELISFLTAAV